MGVGGDPGCWNDADRGLVAGQMVGNGPVSAALASFRRLWQMAWSVRSPLAPVKPLRRRCLAFCLILDYTRLPSGN